MPISAESHQKVLNSRIRSLEHELEDVMTDSKSIDREFEQFNLKGYQLRTDFIRRKDEYMSEYERELEEYQKQLKLAQDKLEKKKEERKTLLDYLKDSGIFVKSFNDLQNFGWITLKQMAASNMNVEIVESQKRKAAEFSRVSRIARDKMNILAQLLNDARMNQMQVNMKKEELISNLENWQRQNEQQQKQISKMESDHERLNLLIKQCGSTNEPMSEFIFKNVRAECQSFLNSKCPEELLNGLLKFKTRQERIIKLLKHKDIKLARETNSLTVASDQTADLMQYYDNLR